MSFSNYTVNLAIVPLFGFLRSEDISISDQWKQIWFSQVVFSGLLIQPNLVSRHRVDNWSRRKSMDHWIKPLWGSLSGELKPDRVGDQTLTIHWITQAWYSIPKAPGARTFPNCRKRRQLTQWFTRSHILLVQFSNSLNNLASLPRLRDVTFRNHWKMPIHPP
jgi:hypothetical protein